MDFEAQGTVKQYPETITNFNDKETLCFTYLPTFIFLGQQPTTELSNS